ncbi:hypothetical protein [Rhodobacteraceae phage LS06-2018-MD06]|jgi:hypothetical protein|nr:hypothetical protein [Rhodobacteraceae phage LS06-2018-MD06]
MKKLKRLGPYVEYDHLKKVVYLLDINGGCAWSGSVDDFCEKFHTPFCYECEMVSCSEHPKHNDGDLPPKSMD